MKPFYLFLLFNFLFIIQVNSQNLEIGNKWIYDHRFNLGVGHYTEKFDSIEIVSDTIINGLNYFKLIASEEDPCGIFLEMEYLREENGQIFRLNQDHSDDNLMIDFESTDPYNMDYEIAWQNDIIETNVILDSTAIEALPNGSSISVKYQRIINNSSYGDNAVYKLVDKVGYIQYGFLFPNIGTGLCDGEEYQNLRCFISNNDTIHFTEFDCFESSIKVSTKEIIANEITISPNPVSHQIFLPSGFDEAVIYDLTGKRVNLDIENSSIDVSELKAGFYIVHLKTINTKTLSIAKFIKI